MKQYICAYISDGIERSVKIWASSKAEAIEKMRALPWEPGNGPIASPQIGFHDRGPVQSAALLVLLMVAVGLSAMTFRHAEADLRQVAAAGHFKHLSHLLDPQKPAHRA